MLGSTAMTRSRDPLYIDVHMILMITNKRWTSTTDGLPESKGTIISMIESNPKIKDEFYCLNNRGIYCSKDSGISWEVLDIPWAKKYYLQHPWALAVREAN